MANGFGSMGMAGSVRPEMGLGAICAMVSPLLICLRRSDVLFLRFDTQNLVHALVAQVESA